MSGKPNSYYDDLAMATGKKICPPTLDGHKATHLTKWKTRKLPNKAMFLEKEHKETLNKEDVRWCHIFRMEKDRVGVCLLKKKIQCLKNGSQADSFIRRSIS